MSKQVIVMRKDLSMNKGKMIAQGAHASMKVLLDRGGHPHTGHPDDRYVFTMNLWPDLVEWLEGTFTKVCLGVSSEGELLDLYRAAQKMGLPCALITDSGKTVFKGQPTNTCIAIGPAGNNDIDKITGHLKLL